MMKLIAIISMWIISFILALLILGSLFVLSPAFLGPLPTQNRFLIVHDDDVEILTKSDIDERFPTARSRVIGIDVHVQYEPKVVGGPKRGWFEFLETESFLDSEDFMFELPRIGVPRLTADEITRAYQAILAHAQADPQVSHFQPGQPPITRFVPSRLITSLIRIFALFGFPTLTAFLIHKLFNKYKKSMTLHRQENSLCIHCTYDCKSLLSPTCPECGQPHTIPIEPPVARLAEPGS